MEKNKLRSKIREIPNWPKEGVNFKDICPLLQDGAAFRSVIDLLAEPYLSEKIDKVVGIDARGFILASALAYKLNCGLSIVRKKGKLPAKTIAKEYLLEYGANVLEMHEDAVLPDEKIVVVDDVLATGGTMKATVELIEKLKGKIVGISFLIELAYLKGREGFEGRRINSLVEYQSE